MHWRKDGSTLVIGFYLSFIKVVFILLCWTSKQLSLAHHSRLRSWVARCTFSCKFTVQFKVICFTRHIFGSKCICSTNVRWTAKFFRIHFVIFQRYVWNDFRGRKKEKNIFMYLLINHLYRKCLVFRFNVFIRAWDVGLWCLSRLHLVYSFIAVSIRNITSTSTRRNAYYIISLWLSTFFMCLLCMK